jgi:hypothetical protein
VTYTLACDSFSGNVPASNPSVQSFWGVPINWQFNGGCYTNTNHGGNYYRTFNFRGY